MGGVTYKESRTMQKLTKTLLLLPFLLSAACDAEIGNSEPDGMNSPGVIDTVRVELEVVGPGRISIVSPEKAECTEARRFCTFEFEQGTEIYIEGDFSGHSAGGFAEDCVGRDVCRLTLHRDTLVVASFGEEPDTGAPDNTNEGTNTPDNRPSFNEESGYDVPDVIVDTFTGSPHGHRQQTQLLRNQF